jgi:hypothetical protein
VVSDTSDYAAYPSTNAYWDESSKESALTSVQLETVKSIVSKYERGKLSPREAMASIKKILEKE